MSLALLSRMCDWRSCLMVVRPETVVRWHRAGWRLLWRYKSPPGRPQMPKRPPGRPRGDQHWSTFLRSHAQAIVAGERAAPLGACAVRTRRAARVPRLVARYRSAEES
jgi:hypothetical protein